MSHLLSKAVRVLLLVAVATLVRAEEGGGAGDLPASRPAVKAAPVVKIAAGGRPLVFIVLSPQADSRTERLAADLAMGLERITGAKFEIRHDAKPGGITLGTDREWKGVVPAPAAGLSSTLTREDYALRTEADHIFIVGRDVVGVQNAIWDFFHRVGFRQYFPGPAWEIWPREPDLSVALNIAESPDFYHRHFAFTGQANPTTLKKLGVITGAGDIQPREQSARELEQWLVRNRLVSGFELQAAHAYGAIVRRNPDHFAKNPQDIVPRESGQTRKLDASRPTLLSVAAQDALRQFEADPTLDSVSVEPSDGGGWRADSPLGSPSNQAVTLANYVAHEVRAKFPGRKVGMNAYNEHSPPPDIDVDPDVVVCVATMFLRGGYTTDRAIDGWRARKADIGVRDYLSLYGSSRDYPGQTRADDLAYLTRTIPHYYAKGARYYRTEVSRSWIPHGLGYYLTSRLLWKTSDAEHVAKIADDYYRRAFGPAAAEMKQFHEQYLLAGGRPLLSEDLVGRMYRLLDKALAKAGSKEVEARLGEYVAYTHYLELSLATESGPQANRGERIADLDRLNFRFRNSFVINSGGYYAVLAKRGPARQPAVGGATGPLTRDEALEWIRQGVAANRVSPFEPIGFSTNLVPCNGPPGELVGGESVSLVQTGRLPLHADKPGTFSFTLEGSLFYVNRGPVRLRLFAEANPLVDEPVAELEVAADKKPHTVTLASTFAGRHRLEISDGGAGTKLSWPAGQRVVLPVTPNVEARVLSNYKYDGLFYVPKGTQVVGGYCANAAGKILLPDGSLASDLKTLGRNSHFSIPVPPGQDGKCWKVKGTMRGFLLLTVPPYLARSTDELLVPAEVLKGR